MAQYRFSGPSLFSLTIQPGNWKGLLLFWRSRNASMSCSIAGVNSWVLRNSKCIGEVRSAGRPTHLLYLSGPGRDQLAGSTLGFPLPAVSSWALGCQCGEPLTRTLRKAAKDAEKSWHPPTMYRFVLLTGLESSQGFRSPSTIAMVTFVIAGGRYCVAAVEGHS